MADSFNKVAPKRKMMSIVPGGETSALFTTTTQPKTAGKSFKSSRQFQNPGRRLISSAPAGQFAAKKEPPEQPKIKFTGNASIEDIDKMLEDDALAMLNIKKELNNVQIEELEKLRTSLRATKKEYDNLYVGNNFKETELKSNVNQYNSLMSVERATTCTQDMAKSIMGELTDQTSQVLDDLAAEQRTIKMITLMIKRLDEEIGQCRLDISKATVNMEHLVHDLQLAEHNLLLSRQQLLEQENQFEKLQSTLKSRKDQRDSKISMLHSMSLEGEQSVMKLQQSLFEQTKRSVTTGKFRKSAGTTNGNGNATVNAMLPGNKSTAKSTGGTTGGGDGMDGDEFGNVNEVEIRARRMNVAQMKEAIQRYQSQTIRTEKLQQLDNELRHNLLLQQKKKQELSDHLAQTQFKIQQLASSRQIYQEVDIKDATLANTSKLCDEAKEKEFRLKLNLEEMKQSIPRFLTKVTKVSHPKPNETQLGDAILKLEEEVIKLIKLIGSALLKDATPDDLAMISQQQQQQSNAVTASNGGTSEATNSEFNRLQRLPGFSRMQRQLFYNMMTARPDISDQNVRIDNNKSFSRNHNNNNNNMISPRARKHLTIATNNPTNNSNNNNANNDNNAGNATGNNNGVGTTAAGQQSQSSFDSNEDDYMPNPLYTTTKHLHQTTQEEEPSMNRDTIKSISKLIVEKDFLKCRVPATNTSTKR